MYLYTLTYVEQKKDIYIYDYVYMYVYTYVYLYSLI